ncbi:MAG: MATE family efflux transporter [Clostridia bacterium]|nr:MATE family efflux transporter [Clostridia bacterium]
MKDCLFGDREFYTKLWRLTLPIALQSLMLAAVAAGDALMLGKIDQNQMAAVSLATQIQFVQNMFLSSVTSTGAILGAQYWGKGDTRTINDIFCMMLRLCGAASIAFFAACELIPGKLMLLFAHDPELIRIGAGYLRIAGWSYLLTGISQCYLTIMKVSDHAVRTAVVSSTAVVLNILLNAVFIFGLLGLEPMNANGAALATLIARVIELGLCVLSVRQKGYIRPDWGRLFHRDRLLAQDFRKCALPLLGGALFWGVGFTSYTAIMGHMGADAAAANSVAAVVRDLMCCACNGISSAGGIMVGNELGAGQLEKGRLYGVRLNKLSWLCGILATLIVLALTPLVVSFMKLTGTAHTYLIQMMVIMAFYMIGRCVNTVVINGVFAAGGDTLFDVYSLAVCMWGIAIPLALAGAFALHWPVMAVYACTCLDEVGKLPWVMAHFRRYKWVKDLTRDRQVEEAS